MIVITVLSSDKQYSNSGITKENVFDCKTLARFWPHGVRFQEKHSFFTCLLSFPLYIAYYTQASAKAPQIRLSTAVLIEKFLLTAPEYSA